MRKILIAVSFALALVVGFAAAPASAQQVEVPCSAFTNSPFVCVNNRSDYPVSWVECDGVRAPNVGVQPFIAPHSVGAVKFNKAFCGSIVVHTMDGRARGGMFFDAKNSTMLTIPEWRW